MTNSSSAKMSEMISRASGLQIKCNLFLWLSSDVEKLLQVMDVSCIKCGELILINGRNHHGRGMELMGVGDSDGEDEDRLHGEPHHAMGNLQNVAARLGMAWGRRSSFRLHYGA